MGRLCFSKVLLLSVLLVFSLSRGMYGYYCSSVLFFLSKSFNFFRLLIVTLFCQLSGFGRKPMERTVEVQDATVHIQEAGAEAREMIELMDYKEPGPNTNPKAGYPFSPPPQG
ncbi:Serrate RNA effector molecule like [Melia azedarach]|uniref:Serrate RNA effector molecule like n=1 Tax=Melia azedarach TaxID=155640 RepID=A0ACC1X7V3_MELAZ|nr:Serrate RNA effector molecule like [Melia azedarach]